MAYCQLTVFRWVGVYFYSRSAWEWLERESFDHPLIIPTNYRRQPIVSLRNFDFNRLET